MEDNYNNTQGIFWRQVISLLKKNFICSWRNLELLIDVIVPIIIGIMMSLKTYLGDINQILPILFALSVNGTSKSILILLVEEKSKRYKETQKIMSMSSSAYTFGWFLTGYIRMSLALICFIATQAIFNPIFQLDWQEQYTIGPGPLCIQLCIYGFTAINQSFFLSSLFNDTRIANEIATFITVAMNFFVFMTLMTQVAQSLTFYIIISLVSPQCNTAFAYVSTLYGYKQYGQIFPKKKQVPMNFFQSVEVNQTYSIWDAIIQQIAEFFLYLLLFLYFDKVIPNEYGIAKHPLFFLDSFSKRKDQKKQKEDNENWLLDLKKTTSDTDSSSAMYHEPLQFDSPPSIKIERLQKQFGSLNAVNNISLSLYQSQIFCLLGHNGAGKTTTLNLLTGMIFKSNGKVSMYGMDLDYELDEIRKSLGLCTQKDCLYEGLTVEEHLNFISGIKGKVNKKEIQETLEKTELLYERNSLISELNGGSKRKLSLAMSLVGRAKIIFLDEPTSGMDAFSRRTIWNILERIKQEERTIILTTHFLDEAEILADRIGIMSRGQLLAVGTSDFIKQKFGEGYNLKVNYGGESFYVEYLKKILQNCIPDFEVIEDQCTNDQITFLIPFKQKPRIAEVFKLIESQMPSAQISIKMQTLEDAFIKIGNEEEKIFLEHQEQMMKDQLGITESQNNKQNDIVELSNTIDNKMKIDEQLDIPLCLTQPPRYIFIQQVYALFLRRFYTSVRTNTNYLAILIPFITFLLGICVTEYLELPQFQLVPLQTQALIDIFFDDAILASVCIIGFSFGSTIYISLPVMEREFQLKGILHGMGCRNITYWMGTFLFDLIIYYSLVIFYFIVAYILELQCVTDYFLDTLFIFFCFSFSYLSYSYLCGYFFNTLELSLKIFPLFNFFIMFCIPYVLIAIFSFLNPKNSTGTTVPEYLIYSLEIFFMCFSPFFTLFQAYSLLIGYQNYQIILESPLSSSAPILISERYWVYLLSLLGQSIIFCTALYFFENPLIRSIAFQQKLITSENTESDVHVEAERVTTSYCQDPIKAIELQKSYNKKGPQILQGITFGVKPGEIFGLIGPNGAGKSTTINILTGLIQTTNGNAYLKNKDVRYKSMKVLKNVGICSQFDCIWENLTPLEHLYLIGRIKGLTGLELIQATNYYIQTMGLTLFQNTKAGQLSGGNKRKLCVADALIGGSNLTFFDEPSTGVDPISRRFLLNTLKRNVSLRNCSAIITTQNIEEAELLSERIGILVAGKFQCIGTPDYLRKFFFFFPDSTYGSGYQLSIKVYPQTDEETLTDIVCNEFTNCKKIVEKRTNFLTFSLLDQGFSFYKTFTYMELLKQKRLIDDYSINQNTLEKVFLHFSKVQNEINDQMQRDLETQQ